VAHPPVYAILGGTGTFGQAMTAYLLAYTDATIRIVSRGELLQAEMAHRFAGQADRLRFLLGDIRSPTRLRSALHGVQYVFHAAALKHIDLLEYNPTEAVQTNILGTQNVVWACQEAGVERAVLLSSDKAPVPTSTYGASKLVAERLWTGANSLSPQGTHFMTVRYGNVHGSRGSVVPKWRAQLLAGLPLTVTSVNMTRFFVTIQDAVDLAWFALHSGPRGHILVPHLPAYTLPDLAEAVRLLTMPAAPPLSFEVVGPRPGERLAEILMTDEEATRTLVWCETMEMIKYYAIQPQTASWESPSTAVWKWGSPRHNGSYRSDTWPWRLSVAELVTRIRASDGTMAPPPLCLASLPLRVRDALGASALPSSAMPQGDMRLMTLRDYLATTTLSASAIAGYVGAQGGVAWP
jgi:UDP-N-acetylglucosamine 4,6-dehydratase